MNLYTSRFLFLLLLVGSLVATVHEKASADSIDSLVSGAYFDLNACDAQFNNSGQLDFSEFTAQVSNGAECADLEIVGGNLYREMPFMNGHSCTPGLGGSVAMCVGSDPSCTYDPTSMRDVKIDIRLTPGPDGTGTLSNLDFYEKGPEEFDWINGNSGQNNYPTLFSVRVLREGSEIFLSTDIATAREWALRSFNFAAIPEFTVDEPTVFTIELLGYCPVGNGADVSAWDLEDIRITSSCGGTGIDGGVITGGPFEFCVGDDIPDMVSGVELEGNEGTNSQWVITDDIGTILGLPPSPEVVDFDGAGPGTCLIWHLSFEDGLEGAEVGNNALTDLMGCYDLSNSISVFRNDPNGGALVGGPFTFCVGDNIPDMVSGIELVGNTGPNSQYVVTDIDGVILGLPPTPDVVDFDGAGPGTCLIWHLSFADGLTGAEVGNNALTDLEGCYGLSNPVEVFRNQPVGGVIAGGPFEFCVGDDIPDMVTGVTLEGNAGGNSQWVVTDAMGTILGLPPSPEVVDFDGAGPGLCLIWHLSFEDGLTGAEVGNNALTDLEGCYSLSNSIDVVRNQPIGGEIAGGPFEFCVGDNIPDMVTGITLTGASGANSQWVVTDDQGVILGLPPTPDVVDFDGAGGGLCLIWHLSFEDGLTGAEVGNNAMTDLEGCYSLSNPIEVVRNEPIGGVLEGGPFSFCVGDDIPDMVTGITLDGNVGGNSQWVVTDTLGTILGLPPSPEAVDFDGAGTGVCLIWHLSFEDGLTGAEEGNNALTDLEGCYSLSNPVVVNRDQPIGGMISGGPFEFCVGDDIPDMVTGIVLEGNAGQNSQWVITDDQGVILGLPPMPGVVDFDGAGGGICLIWHLSFADGLEGVEEGNNALTDLVGCYSLSNSIEVIRNEPIGGTISGGPFEFCVGDAIPDMVSGVVLEGNAGSNSQWVITDTIGTILGLPPTPEAVDFDVAGDGICLIWHLSFEDGLEGAQEGNNALTDLSGCYSLSNPIEVYRTQSTGGVLEGGPFEFCVGDGMPDMVTGVTLEGNVGENSQWVVTTEEGLILALPSTLEEVDFDAAIGGVCLIWNLSFADGLEGAEVGNNAVTDLVGCYSLSNPVEVIRNQPDGGILTGGPFEFCVGDSIPDMVSDVVLEANQGSNSQWVITDTEGLILGLPPTPEAVDFDGAGAGTCLIWHLSFEDGLEGAVEGNNALTDLVGCYSLSNPIEVVRNEGDSCDTGFAASPMDFTVYPNPASDRIMLDIENLEDENVVLEVYDAFGKLVKSDRMDHAQRAPLDVSNLGNGRYFIRIVSSTGQKVKSFIHIGN